jgi:ribosome maturation factor RimP
VTEKIIDLLDAKFTEAEFANCFWLDVQLHPGNKLEVILDSDTGISFDTCRQISRYLEGFIDEEGWLGEKYTLEVSSPGVDRPLERQRQYPKHIGRKLEVKMQDGSKYEGTLTEVTDSTITLEYKERRKEGKKRVTEIHRPELLLTEVERARVKISFKK